MVEEGFAIFLTDCFMVVVRALLVTNHSEEVMVRRPIF